MDWVMVGQKDLIYLSLDDVQLDLPGCKIIAKFGHSFIKGGSIIKAELLYVAKDHTGWHPPVKIESTREEIVISRAVKFRIKTVLRYKFDGVFDQVLEGGKPWGTWLNSYRKLTSKRI